jgi:hypothetical protein
MITMRWILALALATLRGLQNSPPQSLSTPEHERPASCPVTRRPAKAFIPPAPYPTDLPENVFWLGTEKLWTDLREPMIWGWAPHQPGHEQEVQPLTAKIFWWRVGYDWRAEPQPNLTVTGRRLDGPAPPLMVMTWPRRNAAPAQATNAIMGRTSAMLTGIYVPTPGCWEITGDYQGDKLSFVVWVEPAKSTGQ